ncbi:PVC-type heme-binding CxxCH protein [Arenibacter sp. GZD96]|uniref:PVC-type heme-binding CxxCH protein n=1 Tax=Aurantibrevibacter litoralis TaxID=3106030 RepID=UPI002AFE036F|nr:PVC-type heme-binding CxxCH protein [Arenibacter sp. GZD-96]MEA1784517.1 PVC-type heme-binding CxxCH protein [Arenibacter sp. GZD-96]
MKPLITRFLCVFVVVAVLIGCQSAPKTPVVDQPRRLELLFLGHSIEHHNSNAYMPILASALTKSGINITYTENPDDLNPAKLALYDGLIIYANHDSITPAQDKALIDYVSGGKAFIPIHCASFCFRNSPEYVDMVGGQFMSHETGTFTTTIIDKAHPITENLEPFATWDETYVHSNMAKDIKVLMEREEGGHKEPWTWVKEYGKGKVFYTAYGHDERTWNQPGFQHLIKEGILWAVDANAKKNWEAFVKDMPKLLYEERANIPNYEKRDPAPKYQLPLSPEESAKLIQVPAGFEAHLFASEPDIINPIAMNWDEKGRLWVIETVDYPNTVRDDKGQGDDRIKICEDTNGDGKADKFTIFAEGLNIPTSFTFANGGILVSQAPYFLFLKDTDGDDKADVKEVIIEGWGTFDTHAGPSNLQNGIDNNIYGVLGYSGFKGEIFGKPYEFRQGVYRFNTQYTDFEFISSTSNNTWGLGITEDNSLFASTANNTHSVFVGIPNASFAGVEGIPSQGSSKIDGHYDMKAITPNVRQVDVFGGFTAAAGHSFYTARSFPSDYWNKVAFVCEPTGGVVHIAKIEKEGAGYIEKDGGNLIASSDEWFSPVEAKVGPDGNVWVLDWYNFIIQHNPTPKAERGGYDAENGEGNAYINPLRDRSRGRIWLVKPKTATLKTGLTALDHNNPKELIAALSNDNMFWRMTAQRLLVEKGDKSVLPALYAAIKESKPDALGLHLGALHALWVVQGLGVIPSEAQAVEVVKGALANADGAVRKAAIQILPKNTDTDNVLLKADILNDVDPGVQLAALLYFADRDPSVEVGKKLYALSLKEGIANDAWLSKALYAAGAKHSVGFIGEVQNLDPQQLETPIAEKIDWESPRLNDAEWKTMKIPQYIENAGLDIDGIIWFRREVPISAADAGKAGTISLGPIDDSDVVYINGQKIGNTDNYEVPRVYAVKSGILKAGSNTIAIWVKDTGSGGGIYGNKDQLFLKVGNTSLPLDGDWKYKVAEDYTKKEGNQFQEISIAALLVKNYGDKVALLATSQSTDNAPANVIRIKTIQNEMKFDISEFVVEAGKSIEVVFENNDFMQHNLLITEPGTKEKVGAAADKLAMDPKGAEKNYVPDMAEVLFYTPIVDPDSTFSLKFTAPTTPGMYPFICTFPGHWRIMQGVMKVVAATS